MKNQRYENFITETLQLIKFLIGKKILILATSVIITLFASIYAYNLSLVYKTTAFFTVPDSSSVYMVNQLYESDDTEGSIFASFISKLNSTSFQTKIFNEGGFFKKIKLNTIDSILVKETKAISNVPGYSSEFILQPYSLSIEGSNPKAIAEYLNTLLDSASHEVINQILLTSTQKASYRSKEIDIILNLYNDKASAQRLHDIKIIEATDDNIIRDLKDKIKRLKLKISQEQSLELSKLSNSMEIANSLGIIDNNFKIIDVNATNADLNIAITESKDIPKWYLYGAKALKEEIRLLERTDLGELTNIPELIELNAKLEKKLNNNLLKILQERRRVDDINFYNYSESQKLLFEQAKITQNVFDINLVKAFKIREYALPPNAKNPIKPNKTTIIVLAFILSLMASISLAIVANKFKRFLTIYQKL